MTETPKTPPPKYTCELCDYSTRYKKDYVNHLLTRKHQTKFEINEINNDKIVLKRDTLVCECGKQYQYRQGLSHHKKTCIKVNKPLALNLSSSFNNYNLQDDIKLLTKLVINMTSKLDELCNKFDTNIVKL